MKISLKKNLKSLASFTLKRLIKTSWKVIKKIT